MNETHKGNECWSCKNKRPNPGSAHIKCLNPDPEMDGREHAKKNGWFNYPSNFHPTWKKKDCCNFKREDG